MQDHTYFMGLALKEAEKAIEHDDVPVGAIIVQNGNIIAKTHNQVELLRDPTAHAEILAITQAVATIGDKRLHEAVMYVTLEPCVMCAGAIVLARLQTLYYATHDPKLGACGSRMDVLTTSGLNHYVQLCSGIEQEKAESLLKHFFEQQRIKKQ
ncbi:MAG: nucleoside deaminase [Candidatus Omnitrophica bacterium]|nr:nucleoside deaminase [Candidatus Omnitrophota bacterium]